jgi:hypothetical protein
MLGTNVCPVLYRPCKLLQVASKELDPAHIRNASTLFCVGTVQIAAATLRDLNDRVVVLPGYLCSEVVDSRRIDLQAGVRKCPFRGHFGVKAGVVVAARSAAAVQLRLRAELRDPSGAASARVRNAMRRV